MNPSLENSTLTPRLNPVTGPLFKAAESRHFSEEEMQAILKVFPDLGTELNAAREIQKKDVAIISRVVKEVFSQYSYEKNHEFATAKCPRDVRYVVAYATQAMISGEPRWFEDKVLIWLKTILQAFEFPHRNKSGSQVLFADAYLEEALQKLPKKVQSIYHTYYRLKQELEKELEPAHFSLIAPFLDQAIRVLTEDY